MRASFIVFLTVMVAVMTGCQNNDSQYTAQTPPPRQGGVSLYPLSTSANTGTPSPSSLVDSSYGASVAYQAGPGSYGAETVSYQDTFSTPAGSSETFTDTTYYAEGPIATYQNTSSYSTTSPAPAADRSSGRPMTFAERKLSEPSPYAPLFDPSRRYAASYPVMAQTAYPVNTTAASTTTVAYRPAPATPAVTAPALSATTVTTTYAPTYAPSPAVSTAVATPTYQTTYGVETIILPDPPTIVRDASGAIQTTGVSNRVALVRVPAIYAPLASNEPVPYTPTPPPPAPVRPALSTISRTPATTSALTTAAGPVSGMGAGGLRLVPAPDVPSSDRPNDAAPSQWFEILRPDNGPLRIGRVSSTCVCVSVRVPNRFIAAGERALVEARIVARPPANNLTYGMYVNVLEPVQTTLDTDVTISLR